MTRRIVFPLMLGLALLAPGAAHAELPHVPPYWFVQHQCPDYSQDTYGAVACAGSAVGVPGFHDGDPTVWEPKGMGASTFHHERGHLFDFAVLTDAHREKFLALTRDPRPWWGTADDQRDEVDFDTYDPPAERFADAFSLCSMQETGRLMIGAYDWGPHGYPVRVSKTGYGYGPSWRIHRRVCQLIWHASGLRWDTPRPRLPERFWGSIVLNDRV